MVSLLVGEASASSFARWARFHEQKHCCVREIFLRAARPFKVTPLLGGPSSGRES